MKSVLLHLSLLIATALAGRVGVAPASDAAVVEAQPVVAAEGSAAPQKRAKNSLAWSNRFANKVNVASAASSASKGVGQVESASSWSGSQSDAEGSEGSITNSDFMVNQDGWGSSWAQKKNGKNFENWSNDYGVNHNVKAGSRSAHQGSGGSSSSSSMTSSSGTAQGTQGSAVDNKFAKNSDVWQDAWGNRKNGNKQISFKNAFANIESGASSSRAIGYGTSSASGKSTINKSMVESEGQKGAQASTRTKYDTNNWNDGWGVEKNGKNSLSFKNSFANKIRVNGGTSMFGVGDAAVKGITSSATGSKSVSKGLSGSGSNTSFKGNKDTWTDAWSNQNGKVVKVLKVGAINPEAPAQPLLGQAAPPVEAAKNSIVFASDKPEAPVAPQQPPIVLAAQPVAAAARAPAPAATVPPPPPVAVPAPAASEPAAVAPAAADASHNPTEGDAPISVDSDPAAYTELKPSGTAGGPAEDDAGLIDVSNLQVLDATAGDASLVLPVESTGAAPPANDAKADPAAADKKAT